MQSIHWVLGFIHGHLYRDNKLMKWNIIKYEYLVIERYSLPRVVFLTRILRI